MLSPADLYRMRAYGQSVPPQFVSLQGDSGQSAPVTLTQDGQDNPDYSTQLQGADNYTPPSRPMRNSPIMQMAQMSSTQSVPADTSSDYTPTTGSEMEANSRSDVDGIIKHMAEQRAADRANDRNLQWMSFFSKLASSKSNTLLGGLGEGAQALTDVTGKQAESGKLLDRAALEDQLKVAEWNREQNRQEAAQQELAKYHQGELGLKKAALAQENIQVIPDGMGGFIQYDKRDPNSVKVVDTGSGTAGGDASKPSVANIYNPPVGEDGNPIRGDDYLKTIPAPIASQAKLYISGDAPPPTGFASKPMLLAAQQAAKIADPTWTGQRYSTIQDFTKGPQTAKTVQAQNVTMEHIGTLKDAIDALNNGDVRQFNKISQEVARQTGSPVPTNFDLGKTIVFDEMAKAILGNNSALSDRQEFVKNMDTGTGKKQAIGMLDEAGKYMAGQAYGLENRYVAGSGLTNYRQRFMTPAARKLIEKYYPSSSTNANSPVKESGAPPSAGGVNFNDLPE